MSHWLYSFTGSNPVVLIVTFGTLWAFGEIGITPPAIGRRKRDRNLQGPATLFYQRSQTVRGSTQARVHSSASGFDSRR